MTVEIFSRVDFEAARPINKNTGEAMWEEMGLIAGEFSYQIEVSEVCSIVVRSSVRSNGYSAGTGKDSIRAWLVDNAGAPVGSKVKAYVTRTAGWDVRMVDMLRELFKKGRLVDTCPDCLEVVKIFKVKKEGKNKGRWFSKCACADSFRWVNVNCN